MKSKAKKNQDLEALTEKFKNSSSALVLSFTGLSVEKDQQFRNEIRETGAKYGVVKNTLARLAVKDTPFEEAAEHFQGVTSVAWTDAEPVDLSKVISKYVKEEKEIFAFKTGVVDGKVVDFAEVETIASLPSKEELVGKLLFLLNAPAQRLATVLSAIPRDLAAVVKQVSEREGDLPEAANEEKAKEAPAEEKAEDSATEEKKEETAADEKSEEAKEDSGEKADEAAPAEEGSDSGEEDAKEES